MKVDKEKQMHIVDLEQNKMQLNYKKRKKEKFKVNRRKKMILRE